MVNNVEYITTQNTDDLPQGTTRKYLNALTTKSPNEITLTYSTPNLSASLIDNTIDIGKINNTNLIIVCIKYTC